ncbi:Cysteine-rich DPF motif domain-containing protein 1 [Varanus komodoensis]|nr:Cysteine-rich DPF motif domain-containing protein 1 [Varanus komodoensis]
MKPFIPLLKRERENSSILAVLLQLDCSLFYSKRFCLPCVNSHLKDFPLEIQQDLEKKTHSKAQSSKKGDSKDSKTK